MKVYDQVFEPNKEGKVKDIDIKHDYIAVLFGNNLSFYTLEGCRGKNEIKTLSTSPYKIEGFKQEESTPTFRDAECWLVSEEKDETMVLVANNKVIFTKKRKLISF